MSQDTSILCVKHTAHEYHICDCHEPMMQAHLGSWPRDDFGTAHCASFWRLIHLPLSLPSFLPPSIPPSFLSFLPSFPSFLISSFFSFILSFLSVRIVCLWELSLLAQNPPVSPLPNSWPCLSSFLLNLYTYVHMHTFIIYKVHLMLSICTCIHHWPFGTGQPVWELMATGGWFFLSQQAWSFVTLHVIS